MRIKERIPIISDVLKSKENRLKLLNYLLPEIDSLEKYLEWGNFSEFWSENPDLRLTQVLINLDILPNFSGFWYYKEDQVLMIDSGLMEARDILLWRSRGDVDKLVFKPISKLETSHIEAILRDNEGGLLNVNNRYLEEFQSELNRR